MSREQEHGDAINAQGSQGFVNKPKKKVEQHFGDKHYHGEVVHNVQGLANPYLGMAAFTYAERHRYAGRDAHIKDALAKLTTPGAQRVLLFVTGASGSGKSSFAQAGLLPALEAHYAERHQTLRRAVMRPSQQPLAMLGDALQQLGMPAAQPNIAALTALMQEHTFGSYINVIILDQFEELFTQSQSEQRDDLLNWLSNLPPFADLRTHLIATMRADYLPELFAHRILRNIEKEGLDLREMTAPELREAIQRPLQSCYPDKEKYFEAGLLDRLATDAAADATYLPLLQVTLEQLWDGGLLKLERYGTLTDAIRDRADEVYKQTTNQDVMMAIFLDLVEVSRDDDARRDVRRRRTWDELTDGRSEREPLVDQLVSQRLLSKDVEQRDGQEVQVVDIIHESLLSNWPRLRDAITAQRERLQRRSRFEHWLRDWEDHNRADDYLLDGVRLSEAEELAAQRDVALQGSAAQELLTRSLTQREAKSRRRLRIATGIAGVLAIFLIIAVFAVIIAFQQQHIASDNAAEADQQRQQAEANANEARAERDRAAGLAVASAAQTELSRNNLDLAYPLALAAAQMPDPAPQARAVLGEAVYASGTMYQLRDHEKTVRSVALSSDGQHAASGSEDRTVRLWDITCGELVHTFHGHSGAVRSVAFSPDGKYLLSGSNDRTLRLWDVASGDTIRVFEGHEKSVGGVAFSPDGTLALSGSSDATVRVWNVATGEEQQIFTEHTDVVWSVAFSPGGQTALSGSTDRTVRVWDVTSGQSLLVFTGHTGNVWDVAFSPDGTLALSGSNDATLMLWEVSTGQIIRTFRGHALPVWSVAFSPDGQTALSGSTDRTVRLWDIASGDLLAISSGHTDVVWSVAFSPDGQTVLSGSEDRTVRLWDIANEQPIHTFVGHTNYVDSVALSPDGALALSGSYDEDARLWDVTTGETIHTFIGHTNAVRSVTFSPDGQTALSGSWDTTLRLWDVATGESIRTFTGHTGFVESVAFSSDGTLALSGSCVEANPDATCDTGEIRLWDVATGETIRTFMGHTDYVTSVMFSRDGQTILSGSEDRTIRLWDRTSGDVLQTFTGHTGEVWDVTFSPDEAFILSGSGDTTLRVWKVASGETIHIFRGHLGAVWSVMFSPDEPTPDEPTPDEPTLDGRTALSGSADGTIRVWDVASGESFHTFQGHQNWVRSGVFSPDGRMLLSGSWDRTLRLWPIIPYHQHLTWACHHRYIPDLSQEQREQFGIPNDLVLCPEE